MMDKVIERAIFAWQHASYVGVMLPAMGATTCSTMRQSLVVQTDRIATLEARLAEVERERDGWLKIVGEIAASVALPDTIRTTGSAADMIDYFKSLRARAEKAERERDEARADARLFEATAKEADKGLECLNDIDEAWDAFGTAGNRKALTLAEQIASRERELEAAEARLAEAEKVIAPFATEANEWWDKVSSRSHPRISEPGSKVGEKAKFTIGDLRAAARFTEKRDA